MRDRLIQYVELLFSVDPDAEEVKQEILQNTLDRYDDLVAQGKSEEAAYRLAISGIGDIREILGEYHDSDSKPCDDQQIAPDQMRRLRSIAIALYIVCAIPLFVLSEFGLDTIGLCLTLILVAVATYLILQTKQPSTPGKDTTAPRENDPLANKKAKIRSIIWTSSVILYLILNFLTHAWAITWLLFPIAGCCAGLSSAVLDLKEAYCNEN